MDRGESARWIFLGGSITGAAAVGCYIWWTTVGRWTSTARRRRSVYRNAWQTNDSVRAMLAGEPYCAADATLLTMLGAAHDLCRELNSTHSSSQRRRITLELFGSACVSEPPYIEPPFQCDYGVNTHIGSSFYANYGCVFLDCAEIRIGSNVFLGPGVHLYTAGHPLDAEERRRTEFAKSIIIGDDVWIGGGSTVLPGVKIGDRAVIAAGAVVAKDVGEDELVGGVPARAIRKLNQR